MPDNLSVTISADASQVEVAAQKAKAALSSVTREMTQLRNEAQKTGDWSGVEALAPKLAAARGQMKATTAATKDLGVAAANTSLSLGEMGKMLGGVTRAAGIAIPGIKALRLGFAAFVGAEVIRAFTDITAKVTELGEQAKKIGLDTGTIKQFRDAIGSVGGKADDAAGMLEKMVGSFSAEKKKAMSSWWGEANDAAREGRPIASDYIKAISELDSNFMRFGTDAKGLRDLAISLSRSLVRLADAGKIDDANRLSVELLGKTWRQAEEDVRAFVKATQGAQLPAAGIASPQAQAAAKSYSIALNELSNQWDQFTTRLTTSGFAETVVHALTGLVTILEGWVIAGEKARDAIVSFWGQLKEFGSWLSDTYNATVGTVAKAFQDAWNTAIDFVADKIRWLLSWYDWLIAKAKEALSYLGIGGGSGTTPTTPATVTGASGGYVRGPGSGTSDSILARLSNGEFVVRARAVDHWGPRFLHALNNLQNPFGSYATGGLVRTTPRFASGGMVTARTGDGATVNLHFPGGQFQLHGDKAIVAGLTREARRAGMLSAGRMPGALA
jgi:hypothetical protein